MVCPRLRQHGFSGLSTHYLQQAFIPRYSMAMPKRETPKPHIKTGKLRPKAWWEKTKTQASSA